MRSTTIIRGRKLVLGLSAVAMVMGLSACSRIRTHQGMLADKLLIDSIQPGIDNRDSVEGALGRPTFTSQFGGSNDYYYVGRDLEQLAFANPKPVAQTALRVRFDGAGNVASVERIGLDKVATVSPARDKTPTLGRDRSLWEDIFGNIGAVGALPASGGGRNDNTGPNGS